MKVPDDVLECVDTILATDWATWAADEVGGRMIWANADAFYALLKDAAHLAHWVESLAKS